MCNVIIEAFLVWIIAQKVIIFITCIGSGSVTLWRWNGGTTFGSTRDLPASSNTSARITMRRTGEWSVAWRSHYFRLPVHSLLSLSACLSFHPYLYSTPFLPCYALALSLSLSLSFFLSISVCLMFSSVSLSLSIVLLPYLLTILSC